MQKRILLILFLGIIFSVSVFSQNLKAEKVILPDSELANLYKIDSGVYRSEQPSSVDFKALEKYGIKESLNLRNRHSDDDEAAGTAVKLHRVKMKAHSVSEEQLIRALRIINCNPLSSWFRPYRSCLCALSHCISECLQRRCNSRND